MSEMQADAGRNTVWIVIGGVVALAAVGYIGYTYLAGNTETPPSSVSVNTSAKGTPSPESEHYGKVLKQYNDTNAEQAAQGGKTYLSVISTRDKAVAEQTPAGGGGQVPPVQTPQAPQVVYVYQPAPQQAGQQQTQVLSEQEKNRRQRIHDQAAALMLNWSGGKHGSATVTEEVAYASSINVASNTPVAGQPGVQSAGTPGANGAPVVKIIEDFVRIPALLDTDLDTDENSTVFASVPSGPYAGLTVIANGYKRINESVDMTFTAMKWRGRSYKITAKAIDQNTLRSALSGDVNNRYFTRIILPAIAAGIGRTGQLYEQSSSQNIITPQGGVIQTYPTTPNGTAVLGTMVGGMGETAGRVLAQDAAQMPAKQVLIPQKTTIGIQFMAPVLSTDDLSAGAGAPAMDLSVLSQPASQPPVQQSIQQQPSVRPAGYPVSGQSAPGLYPGVRGSYPAY